MLILLLTAVGMILVWAKFDICIGYGFLIVSVLLIQKKKHEGEGRCAFIDSVDGFVLSAIFAFWVEMSVLLRVFLRCYYGEHRSLKDYNQVLFVLDLLRVSHFPEGYEICNVIRWGLVATTILTFVLIIRGKCRAVKRYEEVGQRALQKPI